MAGTASIVDSFDDPLPYIKRSISLVGEKERKVLKEIVKQAKRPVKSRTIPPGKCYSL